MLLVIDVGNTNSVFGVYRGDKLVTSWRVATRKENTSDEIGMFMMNYLAQQGIPSSEIEAVMISSVVPPVMYSLEHAVRKFLGLHPLVVGPGVKTGINIRCDNPKEVGADRIVNAVAGLHKYGGPLILIDFGTATTFCAVTKEGDYLGGVISAGIKISMEALFEHAAKLPRIEISNPGRVIGKTTIGSMQSGAVYGYAGSVDRIVSLMKEEMGGGDIKVIATGGLARLIAEEAKSIDLIDQQLTLLGLKLIYEMNVEEGTKRV